MSNTNQAEQEQCLCPCHNAFPKQTCESCLRHQPTMKLERQLWQVLYPNLPEGAELAEYETRIHQVANLLAAEIKAARLNELDLLLDENQPQYIPIAGLQVKIEDRIATLTGEQPK